MGIRITDDNAVALYDSVSDFAFGPVFPSEEACMDFLDWAPEEPDLRTLTDPQLEDAFGKWVDARGAEYGFEPAEAPE